MATDQSNPQTWVSDKIMSSLGYSTAVIVQYVVRLSQKSSSPADLAAKLLDVGFSPSPDTHSFAEQVFSHFSPTLQSSINPYQQAEKAAAQLARKHYPLVEPNDNTENHKHRCYRKRTLEIDDDDVLRRDRKEREELERRIRERDAGKTRKVTEPRKVRRGEEETDVSELRRKSREDYLRARRERKLAELRDQIIDDDHLFKGENLTEAEEREMRRMKEVYRLVKDLEDVENIAEYKMPEERRNPDKVRVADGDVNPNSEREAWEQNQIGKAIFSFGSKDRKPASDDYQFVFEDGIQFLKGGVIDGGDETAVEPEPEPEPERGASTSKYSALEKLQEERKNLPVYHCRDELLQAIHDNPVLIIVGETGSGKTTQIPQYLFEAGYGKIGCTQPRRVAAMSVAARVSEEMGVKLGREVGYSIRFEDCTSEKTVLKYMTDGMLLREFHVDPELSSYNVLMVDEAHERTLSTDILFGLVKDLAYQRKKVKKDIKLLISSATLDAEKFSEFFGGAPIFTICGRSHPVEIYYAPGPEADYVDAAIVTVLQTHVRQPLGDILVFLTGQEEIETVHEILKQRIQGLGKKIPELIICPIYANLPTELQTKIFEPTPKGARKVILATNIAETSLTVDGIKYVIDPGYCKVKSYNPRTGMESLLVRPISKASAMQRAGRCGRTGPGKCYRLYTSYIFQNEMEDNVAPEIQRTDLACVVLTLKGLGVTDVSKFNFMDQPPSETLLKALEQLYALSALNECGELTTVGSRMAEFPLNPMLSKMIVASHKYKCSEEIISIAAMLEVGNSIFYRPKDKQVHADNAKMNFYTGNVGDHIALMNLYNSWKETDFSTQWCYENYIQVGSLKRARDIRDQLAGLLERVEIDLATNPGNLDAIKKAIMSGFFPNMARLQKGGVYRTLKNPVVAHIHPSSGLAELLPRCVIYNELVLTTKEYMRNVIDVKSEWLKEIAPHYYELKDIEELESKKMPRGVGRPSEK